MGHEEGKHLNNPAIVNILVIRNDIAQAKVIAPRVCVCVFVNVIRVIIAKFAQ